MDIEIFEDIGLTKREIKVYLALLELGSTTIGSILEKTQIPSSKIYEIINRLKDKGLVSYVKIENKRHYQAADPDSILTFLDEKRNKISEVLPELLAKQKLAKKKQSVELYEGKKAIFNLFRNLISNTKPGEIYQSFTPDIKEHSKPDLTTFYKNLQKRRAEKKLNVQLLIPSKDKELFKQIYSKQVNPKSTKFTNFVFPQGITIFRNTIILLKWAGNPSAIKIESGDMAEEFRSFFSEIWKI